MYRLIKLFLCVLMCFFLVSTGFSKEKAWRVRGGVQKAFKDSKNRVWGLRGRALSSLGHSQTRFLVRSWLNRGR